MNSMYVYTYYTMTLAFHDEDNMEYIVRVGSEMGLGQEYPPARF